MTELDFHRWLLIGFVLVAACTMPYLLLRAAPYGRHARAGLGPSIDSTLGWVLMEAPAALLPLLFVGLGGRYDVVTLVFLAIWESHYLYRAFVFPFRRRGGQRMALLISLSGMVFNFANGYLNWRLLTALMPARPADWLSSPAFLGGLLLFAGGLAVNHHSDHLLIHLRRPGETGYKIPRGGLFGIVSCPNYLGEIVEWSGWALLTWTSAGLAFALWTAANLLPRALSHHRYYREKFLDYPSERKALIPYLL